MSTRGARSVRRAAREEARERARASSLKPVKKRPSSNRGAPEADGDAPRGERRPPRRRAVSTRSRRSGACRRTARRVISGIVLARRAVQAAQRQVGGDHPSHGALARPCGPSISIWCGKRAWERRSTVVGVTVFLRNLTSMTRYPSSAAPERSRRRGIVDRDALKKLLEDVRAGRLSVADGRASACAICPSTSSGSPRSTRIAPFAAASPKPSTARASRSSRSSRSSSRLHAAGQTALVTRVGPGGARGGRARGTRRPSTTPRRALWSCARAPKREGAAGRRRDDRGHDRHPRGRGGRAHRGADGGAGRAGSTTSASRDSIASSRTARR